MRTWLRNLPVEHRWALGVMALSLAYTALFFLLSLLRHHAFVYYDPEDVGEVSFLLRSLASGDLDSLREFLTHNRSLGSMHFMPILLPVSLLYWIHPGVETLFFYSSAAIGAAAVPIYYLSHAILKEARLAFALALAYLLYAPKHSLVFLDGDPLIFLVALIPLAYFAIVVHRRNLFIGSCLAILACRSETGLAVLGLSVAALLERDLPDGFRKTARVMAGVGLGVLVAALAFHFHFTATNPFYNSPIMRASSLGSALEHAAQLLEPNKLAALARIFLPVGGLALLHPYWILFSLQDLGKFLIVDHLTYQRAHYFSGLLGSLFIVLPLVLLRFRGRWRWLLAGLVLALSATSNIMPNLIGGPYPENAIEGKIADRRFEGRANVFDPEFYRQDPLDRRLLEAIRKIPGSARVSGTGDLLPHLASRPRMFQFLDERFDYLNVDYVIVNARHMYWGAGHYEWHEAKLGELLRKLGSRPEWKALIAEEPVYLFERVGSQSSR